MTPEEKLQKAITLIDKYIEMLGRNCQTCKRSGRKGRVMSRITITIDTEYIPDRFVGWPDVNIVLRCKPKDKYKAELVADLIAGMDCFDVERGE